ncbi:MAG: succinylglutamate desuccinylase/aspartoacylase family protein [Gemmatimonadota bacterium]|jgi:hypothetical protein
MLNRSPAPLERVIAHRVGDRPGATVVLVAGLHGNEPAGVIALRRVAQRLPSSREIHGEILALAGNLAALERGVRFIDSDMNRGWWPDDLERGATGGTSEDFERRDLLATIQPSLGAAADSPIVLDFHTTSAESPPFVTLGDTLRNRAFAMAFPLPVVLGIEEQLAGTFLEYVNNRGCITMGCEGGRHDDPRSVDRIEAVAWIGLAQAGIVDPQLEPVVESRARLRTLGPGRPAFLEVRHRHPVPPDRTLTIRPGFRSFQPVTAGDLIGHWNDGEPVHAPESGQILMPLYQDQGDDGFFIVRSVRDVWLRLSSLLRRLRLDRVAPLLPGVRRHPYMPNAVVVDRRVARWRTVEIFHLLGYRRTVEQGPELILSRRHFDDPVNWA